MATNTESRKGIIICRMYAGRYLSSNLGHEVINMIQADNGNSYVYINPYGTVSKEAVNFNYVLFVRLAGKNLFEIIGMASGLEPAPNVVNIGNKSGKVADDILESQIAYIDSQPNGITYAGVNILDLFGKGSMQNIYVTFKAESVKEPKPGKRIFLFYNKDRSQPAGPYAELPGKVVELNQHNWPRTPLKTYITPVDSQDANASDYTKIVDEVILNASLWQDHNVGKVNISQHHQDAPASLFSICQIQDNENCISNALAYFMTLPSYKDLWKGFFNDVMQISLYDVFQVSREVDAKIDGDKASGGRIDILIEDGHSVVVIENKIKSDINSIERDSSDKTQLDRYSHFIQASPKYKGMDSHFFILSPNYNIPVIEGDMKHEYRIITYGQLYEYLKKDDIMATIASDTNFHSLIDVLKRHSENTPNGYLRDEMMVKFYNRINKLNVHQ